MPRNFGLNQRNPDDGDPPLSWVDDHWEVVHEPEASDAWIGWTVLLATIFVGCSLIWMVW
jgi:hypothetical protein